MPLIDADGVYDGEPVPVCVDEGDASAESDPDGDGVVEGVREDEGVCDAVNDALGVAVPEGDDVRVPDEERVPVGVGVAHTITFDLPIIVYGDGSRM